MLQLRNNYLAVDLCLRKVRIWFNAAAPSWEQILLSVCFWMSACHWWTLHLFVPDTDLTNHLKALIQAISYWVVTLAGLTQNLYSDLISLTIHITQLSSCTVTPIYGKTTDFPGRKFRQGGDTSSCITFSPPRQRVQMKLAGVTRPHRLKPGD